MTQNRLVGLAQISTENDICSEPYYSALINDLTNMKARKVNFVSNKNENFNLFRNSQKNALL